MSAPPPEAEPRRSAWSSVKPFLSRPVLVVIALGFASGLPLSLIFDTLSVWLRDENLSLSAISYFSLVTFSYSLKFVWAPVLDRVRLPGLTALLGHRRSWMLASQTVIILGLWTISGLDPQTQLGWMALAAAVVGFAGATQDVVIDAWRIETAGESETRQAIMAAAWSWGARVSPFVSGIVPLLLADTLGWGFAYALMAALMGLGVVAVLLAPEETEHRVRAIEYGDARADAPKEALEWVARLALMFVAICLLGAGLTASIDLFRPLFPASAFDAAKAVWTSRSNGIFLQFPAVIAGLGLLVVACMPVPGAITRPGAYLRQTFVAPVLAFFDRYDRVAGLILATICLYRVSDFLLNVNGAFYVDLGFELPVIAEVRKVFGVLMTMLGVAIGGVVMARLGTKTALLFGAVVGSFSNLAYGWLATQGDDVFAFALALGIDNVSGGIAGTVLIAFMSSLITKGYAAQQYALFTSLYALPGKLLASQSGRIVEVSAQGVDAGALGALPNAWFADLPETAYRAGAATLGVAPQSLGAGYVVFYFYSSIIGILAIGLSLWLVQRQDFFDALKRDNHAESKVADEEPQRA